MQNTFPSLDVAFINSAYLSELWAVHDLLKMKKMHASNWTKSRENQLQDEIKHANILLNALKESKVEIVYDLSFSMQERLYKKYIDLSCSTKICEFSIVHEMTESRALWIYKTFLRINPQTKYKSLLLGIIDDEKNHFNLDPEISHNDQFSKNAYFSIDKIIFRKLLPQKYGNKIFFNENFWTWYYSNSI